ncbi:sensor histidine kinase [Thalassotalea sp. ND16A]|uniref:sensor histidine kinase n=1 Tax=Thalassotalea sp. ND16A TaxID=1535422 RepID=UPI00069180EB|nr:histidine kinase [Thalassotalea sp. ND16A]
MAETTEKTIFMKNIALLLVSIWLGLAFYALLSQISNWLTSHHFEMSFFSHLEFFTIRVWLPWVVLTPVALKLATQFPVMPKNWLKALLLHAFFLLSLSIIAGLLISFHYHFFEDMAPGMETYQPWQHIGHFLFGDNLFLFNTIIYTILVTYMNIKHFAQIAQQKALIASQLNHQLIESQLQTLKMQINPHFLFNTLNVISVLVMKSEKDKATDMINLLSSFFRNSLDEKDQQWIPLQKELQHVEQYLAIEQVRFGDKISIVKNYDNAAMSIPVPSMLLQPLIENAMQHGLEQIEGKGQLSITCAIENEYLFIIISDDGAGCDLNDNNFKQGIGLSNVKSRLQQLYGTQHQFKINSNEFGGITVSLKLAINIEEEKQ